MNQAGQRRGCVIVQSIRYPEVRHSDPPTVSALAYPEVRGGVQTIVSSGVGVGAAGIPSTCLQPASCGCGGCGRVGAPGGSRGTCPTERLGVSSQTSSSARGSLPASAGAPRRPTFDVLPADIAHAGPASRPALAAPSVGPSNDPHLDADIHVQQLFPAPARAQSCRQLDWVRDYATLWRLWQAYASTEVETPERYRHDGHSLGFRSGEGWAWRDVRERLWPAAFREIAAQLLGPGNETLIECALQWTRAESEDPMSHQECLERHGEAWYMGNPTGRCNVWHGDRLADVADPEWPVRYGVYYGRRAIEIGTNIDCCVDREIPRSPSVPQLAQQHWQVHWCPQGYTESLRRLQLSEGARQCFREAHEFASSHATLPQPLSPDPATRAMQLRDFEREYRLRFIEHVRSNRLFGPCQGITDSAMFAALDWSYGSIDWAVSVPGSIDPAARAWTLVYVPGARTEYPSTIQYPFCIPVLPRLRFPIPEPGPRLPFPPTWPPIA